MIIKYLKIFLFLPYDIDLLCSVETTYAMSAFWRFKVEHISGLTVKFRVWAVYTDCQWFQHTYDWLVRSIYLANSKIEQFMDGFYIGLQLAADPDLERGQAYCYGIEDPNEDVALKLTRSVKMSDIRNQDPSRDFYEGNYVSEEEPVCHSVSAV